MCVWVCLCLPPPPAPPPAPPTPVTDARLFMCEVWECRVGRWAEDMHVFASACVNGSVCGYLWVGLSSSIIRETALVRMCRHVCECICIRGHMCAHVSVPAHTPSNCTGSQMRTCYPSSINTQNPKLLSQNQSITDGGAAALAAEQMMS